MTTKMNWGRALIAAGIGLSLLGGVSVSTAMAQDSGRQKDKNNMRNLGVGLGAAAAYEALHHRNGSALILGAGAVLSGKKYEDARKAQSRENSVSDNDSRREYRYEHGNRVGYTAYRNGRKVADYRRLRDSDGDWTSRYKAVKWY